MRVDTAGNSAPHVAANADAAKFNAVVAEMIKPSGPPPMPDPNKPSGPNAPTEPKNTPDDPNMPAEVATGDVDYYQKRNDDFIRRNPGVTPPPYYLEYGNKYAHRFSELGPMNLSPAGLAWRDKTLKALQEAIEEKRRTDPAGFAALERDPEAFKKFAYETHPKAYIDSGLFDLSAQDIAVIGTTPDLKDILTQDGIKGVLDTAAQVQPKDVVDIAVATAKDGAGLARVIFTEAMRLPLFGN